MKSKQRGAVLPFVCGLFLVLTYIFSALLNSTGSLRSRLGYYKNAIQEQYNAESAILLSIHSLTPPDSFLIIPLVHTDTLGPWLLLEAPAGERVVRAWAGFYSSKNQRNFSHQKWEQARSRCFSFYNKEWRETFFGDTLYGNTHFYKPLWRDIQKPLYIATGDFTLDLYGEHSSKLTLYVEGDISIYGQGILDSLHLFATGSVTLSGNVNVRSAAIYARQKIEVRAPFQIRGVLLSEDTIITQAGVHWGDPSWVMPPLIAERIGFEEAPDSAFFPIDLAGDLPLRVWDWSVR